MQQSQTTAADQHKPFTGVSSRNANSFVKQRRVSITIAGAFLVGLAILALSSKASGNDANLTITGAGHATASATPQNRPVANSDSGRPTSGTDPPATVSQNSSTTTVQVNGQNIPIPSNGNLSKIITNGSGTTTIDVSNSSSSTSSSSTNSSSSNIDLQVNSSSSSSGDSAE